MTTEQRTPDKAGAPSADEPRNLRMVIGGEQVDAADGQTFDVINPANGKVIARAPLGGREDVDRAVAAARKAFDDPKGFSSWSASKRGRTLAKYSALVKANIEELAQLETANVGKPIKSSRVEALAVSLVFEYYAGGANKLFGETIPVSAPGLDFTLREPIGVVGLIVPWNFPMNMASWKLGPALAAGNTCILKPASYSPMTAIRLGELALEAGFPPGVVNVVTGPGGTVGASMAAHDGIGKIAFTGETTTGQEIMRLASGNVKKISLELGGKSPNVVFADADLERFAAESPYSVFDNCGQDCCARSRILVERSAHDGIGKIAFTGETTTGQEIMRLASGNVKKISLELGGKSPNVVFADADLERFAAESPYSVFDNCGQDCCARSRILVERSAHDKVVELFAEATRNVKVGDPFDESTEVGPMVSLRQRERVLDYIGIGQEEGAELVAGGGVPDDEALADGAYILPTIFDNVDNDMRIAREEVFGPVVSIIPFETEEEAVRLANATPYGLSGSIWSRDIGKAIRTAKGIRSGVLSINSNSSVHTEAPFGGYKMSGMGRELGMHALELYTEIKNIYVDLR